MEYAKVKKGIKKQRKKTASMEDNKTLTAS